MYNLHSTVVLLKASIAGETVQDDGKFTFYCSSIKGLNNNLTK